MDFFTKKKMIFYLIIILIITNLLLIIIFIADKQTNSKNEVVDPENLAEILKQRLNLSDEQAKKINIIRSDFYSEEKVLSHKIRAARDSMNQIMFNKESNDSLLIKLAKSISEKEFQMELLRIEQAKSIKSVCNPKQIDAFQDLVKEIRDYLKPDRQKK